MWPLDKKLMEKVFGPFTAPVSNSTLIGPDVVVHTDFRKLSTDQPKTENGQQDLSTMSVQEISEAILGKENRPLSLAEQLKIMQNQMPEDKHSYDAEDQRALQESIDLIQKCITISSQQVMLDRLSVVARQLKFKAHIRPGCFIFEAPFFHVEIKLEQSSGRVYECNIQHQDSEKTSCSLLVEILQEENFDSFISHMDKISALYSLANDKNAKLKIFQAFVSLEKDIVMLGNIAKNSINDCNNLVHNAPVGVVEPRQGGNPLKLIYFVRPDELFDRKAKMSLPFTVESLIQNKIGNFVTVEIEACDGGFKLQQRPLCDIKDKLPEIEFHTTQNSSMLHACFMLKLSKPLALCDFLVNQISALTNQKLKEQNRSLNQDLSSQSLLHLIASNCCERYRKFSSDSSFIVQSRDHDQDFVFNKYSNEPITGIVVKKIRFNHPAQVSKILTFLRQQLLFNAFVENIIKSSILQTKSLRVRRIDITFDDIDEIVVKFTNPVTSNRITLIIRLDGQWSHSAVRCRLLPTSIHDFCTEEKVLKVLQRTSSISDAVNLISNRIIDADRKSKEALNPSEPFSHSASHSTPALAASSAASGIPSSNSASSAKPSTQNTMLMNMLQDTGHAGKKRSLDSSEPPGNADSSTGSKEVKKRRRTESNDSKSSTEPISTTLNQNQSQQQSIGQSLSSNQQTSPTQSLHGSSLLQQNSDLKKAATLKNITLLQPALQQVVLDATLKQKLALSKNNVLAKISRQNSAESTSTSAPSGMPGNLVEILNRAINPIPLPKLPNTLKDGKIEAKKPDRRNTLSLNNVVERLKQNSAAAAADSAAAAAANFASSTTGTEKADNAFTVKQTSSTSLKIKKTTTVTSGSATSSSNPATPSVADSSAASDLMAKISQGPIASLFGKTASKYTIPKIPKVSQTLAAATSTTNNNNHSSLTNALTDFIERKQQNFVQRPGSVPAVQHRNISPMRLNPQQAQSFLQQAGVRSPIQSTTILNNSLFANKLNPSQPRMVNPQQKFSNKPNLHSIANALLQRQKSAPIGVEEPFKLLPTSTSAQNSSEERPLSTPSSPIDSPSTSDLLKNNPTIIPVDAVEPTSTMNQTDQQIQ